MTGQCLLVLNPYPNASIQQLTQVCCPAVAHMSRKSLMIVEDLGNDRAELPGCFPFVSPTPATPGGIPRHMEGGPLPGEGLDGYTIFTKC
jgi:hypothetical protein